MNIQLLEGLRRNLQALIAQSGLSVERYAASKNVPVEVLDRLLACNQDDPGLAANLSVLSEKLGVSVAQLLSTESMACWQSTQIASNRDNPGSPDHLLARQLGRLIEDFVECNEAGRFEVTALAQELAEEELRRTGKASGPGA